ncbi:hypothetical protein [Vibrio sp. Vb1980]
MKKMLLSALLATTLVGCSDNDVADVGLGWFTLKNELLITNTLA